jgi:septal ring-binding cell division protein DamX
MKHTFLSLAMALLAVPALHAAPGPQAGQQKPSTPAQTSKPAPATQARPAAVQTHVVNADFVSYDTKTHKITIKDEKGQTSTVPLQRRAILEVGQLHLKNGDHMMLTCRDNAKGEHQAVTDIKLAKPRA